MTQGRRTLRVAFVMPALSPGPVGGYRVVYDYAVALAAAGDDVEVVHLSGLRGQRSYAVPRELLRRLARRPAAPGWYEGMPADVAIRPQFRLPDLSAPDAVIATSWRTADAVHRARLPAATKKFYFVQGYEDWGNKGKQVDATWRLPLHKVVISDWLAEKARSLNAGPVRVVHNGVDTHTFRLAVPPDERSPQRVLMMWHPAPDKRSADALAALELVRRNHSVDAHAFSAYERPPGLPDWLVWHHRPSRADLAALYNSAAIFVSSSLSEGWGLPATEAMACGAALVSTDTGGVASFARHGVSAVIVPPGDVGGLSTGIEGLICDDDRRVAQANAGAARIAQEHSLNKTSAAFRRALMDVVCAD